MFFLPLAIRFGKMFYVSMSLPDTSLLQSFAEKKLVDHLLQLTNKPAAEVK
jgi:hypothetical protein